MVRASLAVLGVLVGVWAASANAAPAKAARVVIIGVDGVSLNVLEPFANKGVTPNLDALMKQGVHGHLESYWPTRTPQVWTSAVTGKLPCQHGVWDHLSNTYFNPPDFRTKKKQVVTVAARASRALWNLLDVKGLRSLVVGWMVTDPPEKLTHGVIVAPKELMGDRRQTTIKGSFYRGVGGRVQPASLAAQVDRHIVDANEIGAAELEPFADIPKEGSPLYALKYLRRYIYTFKWSLARARSIENLTVALAKTQKPDVVLSYFQCPDSMGHRFWIFKESEAAIAARLGEFGFNREQAAELKKRFGGALEACYRDVDARIGRILEATRGSETLVLVLSDHGFGHCERPHPFKDEPYGGVHLDQGVIIAAGPGVAINQRVTGTSILDITPTVLHFLGLPVAQDMRGQVMQQIFIPSSQREIATIPTYEAAPQTECSHPEGYPPRKAPLRPVSEQMGGRNPHD